MPLPHRSPPPQSTASRLPVPGLRAGGLLLLFLILLLAGLDVVARAPQGGPAPEGLGGSWPVATGDEGRRDLDAADDELRAGRPRRAALLLRRAFADAPDTTPGDLLRLARAEGGWGNHGRAARLLEGRGWLDAMEGGEGWRILGAAHEAREAWAEAAAAWARALPLSPPDLVPLVAVRRVLALTRAGDGPGAVDALNALPPSATRGDLQGWVALELVRRAAADGDTATLYRGARFFTPGAIRDRTVMLEGEARLNAGDTMGAIAAWQAVVDASHPAARRSDALSRIGELHLARADTARAVAPLRAALATAATGSGPYRSARLLHDLGLLRAGEERVRAAGALEAGGDPRRAMGAWSRVLEEEPGASDADARRLRLARLLVNAGRGGEAQGMLELLAGRSDPDLVIPALQLLVGLAKAGGRSAAALALEERLVADHPGSAAALDVIFFRADAAHDAGDLRSALAGYRQAAGMAPSLDRAGLARMRWGHLHLELGEAGEAAGVFEDYLEAFPRGRRWDEAAYWAGRVRRSLGQSDAARIQMDRLTRDDPLGYYAVLASLEDGGAFSPDLPGGPAAGGTAPPWVADGVDGVRILHEAGLADGARVEREALLSRAAGDPAGLTALAEALQEAGLHIEGVGAGFAARAAGAPWDRRMARIIFPFPHRELIVRESEERGLDPWLVAALIRQESAFTPAIVSSAGAIGYMQVLPGTAAELAERQGLRPWSPDLLRVPEVNVHLGTAYLTELLEVHGPDLPLVLSAYNAGPSRASRWRTFPEAVDMQRFTERIPFAETRGYVKSVLRNAALYRWLYSDA